MKNIKNLSKSVLFLSLASILGSRVTSFAADAEGYKDSIDKLTPSYEEEVSEDKIREIIDDLNRIYEEIGRESDQDVVDQQDNDEIHSIDETGNSIEKEIIRDSYEDKPVRQNLNEGVDLKNPPLIINEGKADNSEDIKSLEESILNAAISSNAAKFLLKNSPNTVRKIKEITFIDTASKKGILYQIRRRCQRIFYRIRV